MRRGALQEKSVPAWKLEQQLRWNAALPAGVGRISDHQRNQLQITH